jgi:ribose transport system ATP-binding protein
MSEPVLALRGISKAFAGVKALRGVDFEVHEGEIVALIGENGAGKSTLMKVMGGIHQPDSGEILLDGKPIRIPSPAAAGRNGVALIHQELSNLDNLNVASNIFLGREPTKCGPLRLLDSAKMAEDTRGILREVGLKVEPTTPLSRLSIAHQQLVEIAKAISMRSRILIMDEPTSSLTVVEAERLLAMMAELKAKGCGIVFISHRLMEIKACADRVTGLRDGKNSGGLKKTAITHNAMVNLMVGRDIQPPHHRPSEQDKAEPLVVRDFISKEHPKHTIGFEIRRGEILGMGGLIGAGRSELAAAISGVNPGVKGSLTMSGETFGIRGARDAIRRGIYLIPEDRKRCGLVTSMSVRENITLPNLSAFSRLGLISRKRETETAETQRQNLSIKAASVETLAENLSGGNQQKIVLAKWLSLKPRFVIFDEPTRGIDVGSKAEIYALMRDLAERGIFVLMITSDMEELLGISDRILVMREGALVGSVERKNFSEETVMHLAVGGPSKIVSL